MTSKIKEQITELYTKMNYEYSTELIQWNLFTLFSLYNDTELEKIYGEQLEEYTANKEHYDNKPFTYKQ